MVIYPGTGGLVMVKKTSPKTAQSLDTTTAALQPIDVIRELPYATIQYAANNSVLYPIDAIDGTSATIAFAGMGATPITLYWAIKGQDEPAFEPIVQVGSTSGGIEMPIPWQHVSTCIGHTVLIWYTATVAGRLQESLVLELEIQDIREVDLRESLPVFEHAKRNSPTDPTVVLDMHTFKGDETIRIKAWPMIQAGQRLFVTVAGDQHQVPYQFIWVAFDHLVKAAEADTDHIFEFRLSRGWMSRRQDYSALTAHLGVIWDGTEPVLPAPDDPVHENPLPINAQDFHLRTSTLLRVDPALDLPPPHLKESVDCGADGWLVSPVNTVDGAHLVIAYEGMHAGDVVCPAFVGTPGLGSPVLECRTVQEGEASLEFRVPPSAISANFGLPVTLTYSVSHSGTGPWQSPPREVKILDITRLPTPAVEQATASTLDLNTFSGDADCTVIPWPYIVVGQPCWLWVTGELEDGTAYSFQVLEGEPVTAEWLASGVNTPLPRSELQKLADCSSFEVHFSVNFNGQSDKASAKKFPALTLGIVQEDLVLKAPTVREAVGSQLTVYNGRDGVTVRVEYERISPHHTISVRWIKPNGDILPLASKPGNSDPGYVDFPIPREAVIGGIGKTILINYTVTSVCKLASSKTLALQISVPVRLPTPVVPQATNRILDLRTFPGNANITVEPWWFILPGQCVWLRGVGTLKSGGSYTINVYLGKIVIAAEVSTGLADILSRAQLDLLADGSLLAFTCKVTADGSTNESAAVVFPVLQLTVRSPLDDFTPFTGNNWNNWRAGPAALGEMRYATFFGKTCVANGTASTASVGVVLYKDFTGLQVGASYEFSILACTYNGAAPMPRLSLRTSSGVVTGVTTFYSMGWTPLKGTFVASATSMRLEIWSHEPSGISGNDYAITDIRVRG
ncbi:MULTISPECIES: hypothetical protein [unclassified Pseudomonas]|uniref:hypothetical protein n=1 Tax=unclassified Pseudomonas TaxID=196821 RepID=UPI002115975B|nr:MULTISPECIES: hypothetical protein [unclassified Pseudomonas]